MFECGEFIGHAESGIPWIASRDENVVSKFYEGAAPGLAVKLRFQDWHRALRRHLGQAVREAMNHQLTRQRTEVRVC